MEGLLVSVIIPVYNGGVHLARCIESVRAQTYRNLEIILLNDGSRDQISLPLLEMYARVDRRIRLMNKANSGVSDTRNLGIRMAQGAYLQFVDCDDYLEADATALMVEWAERTRSDLVIAPYTMVMPEKDDEEPRKQVYGFLEAGSYDSAAFAAGLMEHPSSFYFDVLWNKLYRRELVVAHGLRFDERLTWCEDALFNFQYYRVCRRFYALGKPIYSYVQNPNSVCHTMRNPAAMLRAKKIVFQAYIQLCKELGLYEDNRWKVRRYVVALTENVELPKRFRIARRGIKTKDGSGLAIAAKPDGKECCGMNREKEEAGLIGSRVRKEGGAG